MTEEDEIMGRLGKLSVEHMLEKINELNVGVNYDYIDKSSNRLLKLTYLKMLNKLCAKYGWTLDEIYDEPLLSSFLSNMIINVIVRKRK